MEKTSKDEVLELVRKLPEPLEIEKLIYRLYLREKLAAAKKDIAAGRTVTAEQMRAQTASWRK